MPIMNVDPRTQILDVPLVPPASWFNVMPDWYDPDGPLIQLKTSGPETGRAVVLVAPEGESVLGGGPDGRPWPAPRSKTGYEFAHVGSSITSDGALVRTAAIAGSIDHMIRDPHISARVAAEHYNADTSTRQLRVRYHDVDGLGVVALGVLEPGRTLWDAMSIMAGAASGDWRHVPTLGCHEFTGSQLVNSPAFRPNPLRRRTARYAITAALGPDGEDVMFGDWVDDGETPDLSAVDPAAADAADQLSTDHPDAVAPLAAQLNRIETALAGLYLRDAPADIPLVDESQPDWDDEIGRDVYGHGGCGGHGCDGCGGSGIEPYDPGADFGYDMPDLTDLPDGVVALPV